MMPRWPIRRSLTIPGCLTVLLGLAVSACWVDFPESRFFDGGGRQDATANSDGAVTGDDQRAPVADAAPAPDAARPQDLDPGQTCSPGAFIRCEGERTLVRCNAAGTGEESVDCKSGECSASLRRCTECDPASAPPKCLGPSSLERCSESGLREVVSCPLGCQDGACCEDRDQDKVTDCDGDCDDSDPLVFPGQTRFQTTARADGSYDYNCDGKDEQQFDSLVACVKTQGGCEGSGWLVSVPACGDSAMFGECKVTGPLCTPQQSQKTQACR